MADNVFILGAGFSKAAGAPLIDEFLNKAWDLYRNESGRLGSYLEHFERVFKRMDGLRVVNSVFREDLFNIEKLFTLIDFEYQYSERIGPPQMEARRSLILVIIKTLDLTIAGDSVPSSRLENNRKYAQDLVSESPRRSVNFYDLFALFVTGKLYAEPTSSSVITFNYDILLDNYLRKAHPKPLRYCLPGKQHREGIKLLKLHGSANWMVCSGSGCGPDEGILVKENGKYVDELITEVCPKCHQQNYMPLIVPPSWDKSQYKNALKRIWKEASEELMSAKRIFVLGYSFPEADLYFKSLLQMTLAENPYFPPFYIVNKVGRDSKVMQRYKDIFNPDHYARHVKVQWCDSSAQDFMEKVLARRSVRDLDLEVVLNS